MPRYADETQSFRHRGYRDDENQKTIMIFGDGPDPVDSKGVALPKIWDNDVTETIVSVPHVG